MFEVGFSELLLIAVVALVVLGPERLPKAARMAGSFMRKARRSFESLKAEVERELEADELKKQLAEIKAAPAALVAALEQPMLEAKSTIDRALHGQADIDLDVSAWPEEPHNERYGRNESPDAPALIAAERQPGHFDPASPP